MRTLIVYYSFDGNTKFIAEIIAKTIKADLLELKPKEEITRGPLKHLWGGRQVMMKEKPELFSFDKNPDDFDVIYIGTPVWAFNYAPAINAFLSKTELKRKKIALFCCHGGTPGNTIAKMRELLKKDNEILGEISFKEPLTNEKEKNEEVAKKWALDIINSL
jgi:flavodoxin